jgi:hypothetical protein
MYQQGSQGYPVHYKGGRMLYKTKREVRFLKTILGMWAINRFMTVATIIW